MYVSVGFYYMDRWQELRNKVLYIYGHMCMKCGDTYSSVDIFYIYPITSYKKLALRFSNLQVLCEKCKPMNSEDVTEHRPWLKLLAGSDNCSSGLWPLSEYEVSDFISQNKELINFSADELVELILDAKCFIGLACFEGDFLLKNYLYEKDWISQDIIKKDYNRLLSDSLESIKQLITLSNINLEKELKLINPFYSYFYKLFGGASKQTLVYLLSKHDFEYDKLL